MGKVLAPYQEVQRLLTMTMTMTILDLYSDATIRALNVGTTTSISPTDQEKEYSF